MFEEGIDVIYADGYAMTKKEKKNSPETYIADAVEAAKKADVAVLFIGLTDEFESEGFDRTHLRIPPEHVALLSAIRGVTENIVVVLAGGAVVEMPWIGETKALLNSYLGGGGDGYTMLNVLDETKELASDVKIITHVNKTYMRQALQAYFEKSTEEKPIRVDMNETRIRLITEETFVNPFTDVAETDWFYDVVLQLAKDGIVNGMTETTFEPQGTLTRAEFATMLYRIAGTPAAEAESTYSDVKTGDWYYNAVVWATEAGVVNGMGDGTFAPNDNITRQEMATMLYRLAKAEKVEEDKLASFPDAESVADWAKDAMNWAVSTEIVNGSTHDDKVNYLDPTATALRCQAAAVACRYLALSK